VRSLRRLEARNIVADQARELGLLGNVLVKTFEQLRQCGLDDLPELAQ
jgi:hypothetical protein